MQSNLSQFQKHQLALITRVTPYAMAGHLLNTTILAIAVAGEVPLAQLVLWCIYSYSIALLLLYRHLKNRGRSPRSFQRAAKKAAIYALFLALPWSSFAVLHLGALSQDAELILIALGIGMAASGTILLSAMPPAAFVYMSGILLPSALKCLILNQKGYLLLAALALSCWGFLAALIAKITRDISERQKAELALAERNVQLALAGKTALVGSYAYDAHTDSMQVDEGYAALHGLPEGTVETTRSEWRARAHPKDLVRVEEFREQAFRERRDEYEIEYRIVRSGGEVRWIESRSFILYTSGGRPQRVVGVNIDVTERKKTEALLKESEALLADALPAGQVMAFEWNAATGLSRRSANAPLILGGEQGGVGSSRRNAFLRQLHPDDRECFRRRIRELCPNNPSYALNFRFCCSDGRQVWLEETAKGEFDDTGKLFRIKGLTRDITERKQAEERLQKNERQFRELLEALPAAIYVTDAAGCITYCNRSAADLWGVMPKFGEDKWCDLSRFYHSNGAPMAKEDCPTEIALKEGRRVQNLEAILERPDGTRIPIMPYPSPLYDGTGAIVGVVNMTVDISERKKAELALAERTLQLALAERAALVGSVTYDADTEKMQISDGYAAIHGFPDGTIEIARSEWEVGVHPEDRARLEELRSRAFRRRSHEYSVDYRIVRPGGEVRWIDARLFVSRPSDGRPQRVVGVNIDVTERKRAEQHQRALNAELDHRVKNVLATVSAIITQTQEASSSHAAFVAGLDRRIKSLAGTHELLSQSQWRGASLAEIARREFAPYSEGNAEIAGPNVTLKAEATQAVAAVLHELTTNAAKYGAFSTRSGRVLLRWGWLQNGSHGRLAIEWREIGGPPVLAPTRTGYGTSIVHELIPFELGGKAEVAFASDGLRCRLEIPAEWAGKGDLLGDDSKGMCSAQAVPRN